MKKLFATFQLSLTVLILTAPLGVALAQTPPPTLSAVGIPPTAILTTTAVPSTNTANTPITTEPLPKPTRQATQETMPVTGGTNTTTAKTPKAGVDANGFPIPRTDLPQAEIPILDVTQETQSTEQTQCVNTSPAQCMSPEQARAAVTPSLTSNQIKFAFLVFIGGTIGGLSWLFSNFVMNGAQIRRAEARFDRQTRLRDTNRHLDRIRASYSHITNSLADIMKSQANGKITFTKDALKSFNKAIVEVELFGSQKSVDASRQLSNLISGARVVSAEEFNKAKNDLIASLKNDLGLKF